MQSKAKRIFSFDDVQSPRTLFFRRCGMHGNTTADFLLLLLSQRELARMSPIAQADEFRYVAWPRRLGSVVALRKFFARIQNYLLPSMTSADGIFRLIHRSHLLRRALALPPSGRTRLRAVPRVHQYPHLIIIACGFPLRLRSPKPNITPQ